MPTVGRHVVCGATDLDRLPPRRGVIAGLLSIRAKLPIYSFSGSARAEISLKGQGFGAAPEVGSADALGS